MRVAHQSSIELCSLLSEGGYALPQAMLLHSRWDIILQAVEGLCFLSAEKTSSELENSIEVLGTLRGRPQIREASLTFLML